MAHKHETAKKRASISTPRHENDGSDSPETQARWAPRQDGIHPVRADRAQTVKDPVCGMAVDPHTTKHQGRTYSFCSAGCRTKFAENPDRYFAPATAAPKAEPVPEG